jgi:FADH2 O2-dependent halogenase
MSKSNSTVIPLSVPSPASAEPDFDFLVIGSGFAGSLIACILQSQGRRVAIVDRTSHPRFAIGESSTPAASLILASLAEQYDLAWLKPFAKYGTWKHTYPDITTGRKRGFSYFHHEVGKQFQPQADHSNELLAAASDSDELSDTQWLRADVDSFFFTQACEAGVEAFENSEVKTLARKSVGWTVELTSKNAGTLTPPRPLSACFLIDASGAGKVLAKHLNIPDDTDKLATNSRAIFGHVTGLPEWSESLEQSSPGSTNDHPFNADHAAQHHVLEEGWLWSLRFDNDITSVGLVFDGRPRKSSHNPLDTDGFFRIINRYPSLGQAFSETNFTAPSDKPVQTLRLQRLSSEIAGDGWAMLPHTAGFIDPLHSTGIAHSLAGIETLAEILISDPDQPGNVPIKLLLRQYRSTVRDELTLVDQLVAGCYDAIAERSFKKFTAFTMCYFAAATTWERRWLDDDRQRLNIKGAIRARPALLFADVADFRAAVFNLRGQMPDETEESFESLCKATLAPFNHVGLFEPPVPNMYGGTAVQEHRTSNIERPTSK